MLGILCGLEQEAVRAKKIANSEVACAAARPQKARWLARELIQNGAKVLMSFGIAGGLEPGLPLGALILGTQVQSKDGTWTCDNKLTQKLSQRLPEAHVGGVWGSEVLVATAREKKNLYERSRCLIVDMESQCAGQVAAEAQIPFLIVRAVCDAADMDVPAIVMASIDEDGSIAYGRALRHVLTHPSQIADLFHVGKGTGKALRVLQNIASRISLEN